MSVKAMARPQISKTPLGQRLTDVRKALGYEARLPFAAALGMNPETLGGYERGDTEPDLQFLAMYKQRFAVNMNWLISADGDMFEASGKRQSTGSNLDIELVETLSDRVAEIYRSVGQKPPTRRLMREAASLYNELSKIVSDLGDAEEIAATLPRLEFELKKRLQQAAAEPGTGKRLA